MLVAADSRQQSNIEYPSLAASHQEHWGPEYEREETQGMQTLAESHQEHWGLEYGPEHEDAGVTDDSPHEALVRGFFKGSVPPLAGAVTALIATRLCNGSNQYLSRAARIGGGIGTMSVYAKLAHEYYHENTYAFDWTMLTAEQGIGTAIGATFFGILLHLV